LRWCIPTTPRNSVHSRTHWVVLLCTPEAT
jgi:hypothetical protein